MPEIRIPVGTDAVKEFILKDIRECADLINNEVAYPQIPEQWTETILLGALSDYKKKLQRKKARRDAESRKIQ